MFWVRYVIIAINERVRVSTITNIIILETITCIFERNLNLILVSTPKPNGFIIDAQILCWIPIKLKVSLKMLQHPMHLEDRMFFTNRFGICPLLRNHLGATYKYTKSCCIKVSLLLTPTSQTIFPHLSYAMKPVYKPRSTVFHDPQ